MKERGIILVFLVATLATIPLFLLKNADSSAEAPELLIIAPHQDVVLTQTQHPAMVIFVAQILPQETNTGMPESNITSMAEQKSLTPIEMFLRVKERIWVS